MMPRSDQTKQHECPRHESQQRPRQNIGPPRNLQNMAQIRHRPDEKCPCYKRKQHTPQKVFPRIHHRIAYYMAGAEGIEPATAVLETDVIPLHHAPVSQPRIAQGFGPEKLKLCPFILKLFLLHSLPRSPQHATRRRSSVIEHPLGKGEVGSLTLLDGSSRTKNRIFQALKEYSPQRIISWAFTIYLNIFSIWSTIRVHLSPLTYLTRMPTTTRIQHRINPRLKKEAEEILEEQGMKPSQAITIFYMEIKRTGGFPFLPTKVPNKQLKKDLLEAEKDKGLKTYKNKKALFDDLDNL